MICDIPTLDILAQERQVKEGSMVAKIPREGIRTCLDTSDDQSWALGKVYRTQVRSLDRKNSAEKTDIKPLFSRHYGSIHAQKPKKLSPKCLDVKKTLRDSARQRSLNSD